MKALIVHAHPEPRSLTASLARLAEETLRREGHEVRTSDLYAMNWKAGLDAGDFGSYASSPLRSMEDAREAGAGGGLSADIAGEQEKLLWADTVILQFPLWWWSVPALMKGWLDRVFSMGFGYGVGAHTATRYGDRYGEGTLVGRRAMLSVTVGGKTGHYSDRGVNGPIEDLLFPLQHGLLFYTGMEVLPPFLAFGAGHVDEDRYARIAADWERRLLTLDESEPLPYRRQNGGDYELPSLRLREGLEAPGAAGFALHRAG